MKPRDSFISWRALTLTVLSSFIICGCALFREEQPVIEPRDRQTSFPADSRGFSYFAYLGDQGSGAQALLRDETGVAIPVIKGQKLNQAGDTVLDISESSVLINRPGKPSALLVARPAVDENYARDLFSTRSKMSMADAVWAVTPFNELPQWIRAIAPLSSRRDWGQELAMRISAQLRRSSISGKFTMQDSRDAAEKDFKFLCRGALVDIEVGQERFQLQLDYELLRVSGDRLVIVQKLPMSINVGSGLNTSNLDQALDSAAEFIAGRMLIDVPHDINAVRY